MVNISTEELSLITQPIKYKFDKLVEETSWTDDCCVIQQRQQNYFSGKNLECLNKRTGRINNIAYNVLIKYKSLQLFAIVRNTVIWLVYRLKIYCWILRKKSFSLKPLSLWGESNCLCLLLSPHWKFRKFSFQNKEQHFFNIFF